MLTSTASSRKTGGARVAIVAAGVISPLGFDLTETLESLRTARDCVTPVTRFPVERCRCKTAGQVPDRWLEPSGNGRHAQRLHRASHMMIAALRETLAQDRSATGGIRSGEQFQPELTVIGTTSGGMSFGEDYYRAVSQQRDLRRAPRWIANYPPQKPIIDAQDAV